MECTQDGQEVFFKIKKTTPFRKLIDAYCKRQGGDPNQILFLFEGSRLKAEQTPEQVLFISILVLFVL